MGDIALPRDEVPGLPRGGRLLGDERLAKLAGRGNERAFALLYERHHQAIYRYCRSIVRNDQDAQDAMQAAMMRAYAALRSHEGELAVKAWLFRIAHNEAISLLRRRRAQDELSEAHEQPGAEVEATVEVRERLATLLADLESLPERQRGALIMRELSGLSIEQIASALETSPGAAKQALFEARESLHDLAEGREMPCENVRQAISERDGRVLRSRRIRAHLRACEECRAFRAAIATRSADLAALAPPLPASAAGAMLARLLASGSGHSGGPAAASTAAGSTAAGSGTAGSGASLGGHAAASLLGKGLAGVAAVTLATAGTAHLVASSHHRKQAGERSEPATSSSHSLPGRTDMTATNRSSAARASAARGLDTMRPARIGPAGSSSTAGAWTGSAIQKTGSRSVRSGLTGAQHGRPTLQSTPNGPQTRQGARAGGRGGANGPGSKTHPGQRSTGRGAAGGLPHKSHGGHSHGAHGHPSSGGARTGHGHQKHSESSRSKQSSKAPATRSGEGSAHGNSAAREQGTPARTQAGAHSQHS